VADRTKANRRAERALPPEDRDPNGYVVLYPEHKKSRLEGRPSPKDQALIKAINVLVAEMVRAEPDLVRADACEAIRRTVRDLLRDAGKVD
jgi:hypothetical protein